MLSWTPLVCVTVILLIYCLAEVLADKTHGYISYMVFAAFISLALFWSGLVPKTLAVDSTLMATLSAFGVSFLIINMGTTIDLETLVSEWKTVLVCCIGLLGLGILAFTAGVALFGREYALCAAPPISGGLIAYQIVAEQATKAGRLDLAGYAALIMGVQSIIGMPVSSFCLKKELKRLHKEGKLADNAGERAKIHLPSFRVFKEPSPVFDSNTFKLAKLGIAAVIAVVLSNISGLNVNVAYLVVGVVLARIGFLQRDSLKAAGAYTICIVAMYALSLNGFAGVSPSDLGKMIIPILGMFVIGISGIAIGSVICGKLVGYSPLISIAVGMTALFGYPGTEIMANEVCMGMEGFTQEEKAAALNYVMPKMIVGGFTTVTIASVVFAGIVAPMIF